jgi:hypothetical protein
VDVRDWVVEAAGLPIGKAEDALAALNTLQPGGNWSLEQEDGQWYVFTGDQWVGRAANEADFASFIAGVALALVIVPKAR